MVAIRCREVKDTIPPVFARSDLLFLEENASAFESLLGVIDIFNSELPTEHVRWQCLAKAVLVLESEFDRPVSHRYKTRKLWPFVRDLET